jgi:hypothetical protein
LSFERSKFSQRREFRASGGWFFIVIIHYQNQAGGDDLSGKVKLKVDFTDSDNARV